MSQSLKGKVALVTGASRGIGAAIVRRLAADGAYVLVHHGHNAAKAKLVLDGITVSGGSGAMVCCDLASRNSIVSMFEDIDRILPPICGSSCIDILVNNAASPGAKRLEELAQYDVDQIVDVNLKGTLYITQQAAARMRDNGRIINVGSLSAMRANADHILYAATKGAINTFTLALAAHLGPRGITVNCVMPGLVETEMSASFGSPLAEAMLPSIALGRIGQPQDVADAVAMLASDDARWITGQWIAASGGQRL